MSFEQLKLHGDNFSYIIVDRTLMEAVVVDSSFNADEITRILKTENVKLKYVISTHGHPDHTAGNIALRSTFGAELVAHALSRIRTDVTVTDGDIIRVGGIELKVIHTPGHTVDSICLLVDEKKLLTGDTLFVGECGRTDLPGGNPRSMYDSLFNRILRLSDDVEVYPGHDYGPKQSSTIGEERLTNYTLQPRGVEEFVEFMKQP